MLKYYYEKDVLARGDNFLNLDSDDSDPDWMAIEHFTKLQKQQLQQTEIEGEVKYDTFLRGLLQQAKLRSKMKYRPLSESEHSNDEEYSNNEVRCKDKPVHDFEFDDEEQALSFIISSEEEDTLVNDFCSWLKSTDRAEKSICDAEKHKLVLMSIIRFDQEQFQIDYNNLFDRDYLNK